MEVGGFDSERGAWRVTCDVEGRILRGLVPEDLVEDQMRGGNRPPHEDVYRWLADHSSGIERALAAKARGDLVRPPFDRVMLGED